VISKTQNPIAWTQLCYELSDAAEHIETLLKEMNSSSDFSVEDFQVQVSHIYAHLNRAWNSREIGDGLSDAEWETFRAFPTDITPVA